jgi:hypothetical protein
MDDERLWKRRFLLFMGARLFGLALVLLGIAIAFSDLLGEGGMPVLGAIIAIMGAIDALFAPRLLKKAWEQQERTAADRPPAGPTGSL